MATATSSFIWLPETLPEDIRGDGVLQIPPGIHSLTGFRRWLHSDAFPEKLKAHFIQGNIYLDISQEAIQTHVLVKKAVYQKLPNLIDEEDRGEFYTDGILFTNKRARISNKPDGLAVLWETIESGRVQFIAKKGVELEIQGTPDWIMEIVSTSSVTKDTKQLRKAYHRAGIREYWLIDARSEEILFHILHWRQSGYAVAPVKEGWHYSRVFGHDFQLVRQRNRSGAWHYQLLVKR
jgi:Uma2 family endonuclease